MSIAGKLTTIAENMPKVYESGQQSEYDRFWDTFQQNGKRTNYMYGFGGKGWSDKNFKPKYDMFPFYAAGMFRETTIEDLKQCLEACGVSLGLSSVSNCSYLFYCSSITTLPKIHLYSMTSAAYMFASSNLQSIEELDVWVNTTFTASSFSNCTELKRLIMKGTLATNGLNLHWSTLLDRESLLSIIYCLKDYSTDITSSWTVTLGPENLAKLTDAEKAIATQKGWTLL